MFATLLRLMPSELISSIEFSPFRLLALKFIAPPALLVSCNLEIWLIAFSFIPASKLSLSLIARVLLPVLPTIVSSTCNVSVSRPP